jgi:phage tail-like protein
VTSTNQWQLRISGPEVNTIYVVPLGQSIIGRAPASNLILNDLRVSSRHAQLDCTASECRITDLESTNGTFLNGEKIVARVVIPLAVGDELGIGQHKLRVERTGVQDQAAPAPPADPGQRQPPTLPPAPTVPMRPYAGLVPPGLALHSLRLLNYLPEIYHPAKAQARSNGSGPGLPVVVDDFFSRFLALFESILLPIDWTVDSFDFYLDLQTAPHEFLPWLASWFDLVFDVTWSDAQRRALIQDAHQIFARRGTRWALIRVLEIYTGVKPVIDDTAGDLEPYIFRVKLPIAKQQADENLIKAIINLNKPAYTNYTLEFA